MKVVRKICIRPWASHTARSDVHRPCLGLIVSLVSRYCKDQQTVTVIVLQSFVTSHAKKKIAMHKRSCCLALIMLISLSLCHSHFFFPPFSLCLSYSINRCCAICHCRETNLHLYLLQIEVHQEELGLLVRSICKLLKERKLD